MDKTTSSLTAIIAGLFGRSEKAISEKLSTEEHNGFAADVTELNGKLEAATSENTKLTADLATATARITELEASLAASESLATTLNTSLTAVTTERDTYKAHYDEAASKGGKNPKEDHNSRGNTGKSSYNANAIAAWEKSNKQ